MNNQTKTILIFILFALFVSAVVWFFTRDKINIVFALFLAAGVSLFSYYYSDRVVLSIAGAKINDNPQFREFITNLAKKAGIPVPKLYIIADKSLNAFATGRDPKHASVCLTQGLIDSMNKQQIEGVLGHEFSHIKNFDTMLMCVAGVMIGFVSILADWFMRSLWYREDGSKNETYLILVGIILAIFSPIVATLMQLAISRQREFDADLNSAKVTSDPEGLASALEVIATDSRIGKFANNATAHLYITNPFKKKTLLTSLFDTHPPIEERIKILRAL